MSKISDAYPATLSIDYPEGKRNRLTNFFRIFMVIPIAIIVWLLAGVSGWQTGAWNLPLGAGGLVVIPTILMLLCRYKYPKWWFDWNLALTRFFARVSVYASLMRDEYPSTDEEQAVHIEIRYPNAKRELKRWLPLVKWIMAIPHYIVLAFLYVATTVVGIIAWFAILFVARYPRSLFDFVVRVFKWTLRVDAYAFLLTTDRYPPFALTD